MNEQQNEKLLRTRAARARGDINHQLAHDLVEVHKNGPEMFDRLPVQDVIAVTRAGDQLAMDFPDVRTLGHRRMFLRGYLVGLQGGHDYVLKHGRLRSEGEP